MPLYVILCGETVGYEEIIDGDKFRPPLIDAENHLQVDVLSAVSVTPLTTVTTGQVVVAAAGTHVQLDNVTCKAVSIKALASNTGIIYLGKDGVDSADGYELSANEALEISIDNVNRLFIDASVSGEGVSYLAIN